MSTRQKWLITGGAGYIGAHIVDAFLADGKDVLVYDSLYRGLESRIQYLREKHGHEIPLIVADIRDTVMFEEVLASYAPCGVIHTAGLKAVGESFEKPDEYFEVNFDATNKILKSLTKFKVNRFIFSSTAAVYGSPNRSNLIKEDDLKNPISPYGASKLAAEEEVSRYLEIRGNQGTSLRFFNVVGSGATQLMDNSVDNLVPIVINKFKSGEAPGIYGTDYPTNDGTCVRDYVDVRDVAKVHLLSANIEKELPLVMNVGTGQGASVREVIGLIAATFGLENFEIVENARREGDPGFLCADVTLIHNTFGLRESFNLADSIRSLFRQTS